MGIFDKLKQFGESMEAASQQMMNTQLAVFIDNQEVKIGEELSGIISITTTTPITIKSIKINLMREQVLGISEAVEQRPEQWIFNKEVIQQLVQVGVSEAVKVPFKFIVKDGLEYQPLHEDVFNKTTIVGLNPAVLPDSAKNYTHKLIVATEVEGLPMGPIGGVNDVNFVYPTLGAGITLTSYM